MPSHTYSFGPSVIVNGVCSSVYVIDHNLLYCDRGEAGPHHYHEAQTSVAVPSWWWLDTNPDVINDPRVLRLEPK